MHIYVDFETTSSLFFKLTGHEKSFCKCQYVTTIIYDN